MKSNLLLPALVFLIFMASACEKENKYPREELPVTFISSVTTEQIDPISRVVGSSWSQNDKIGVFMMETQKEFSEVSIPTDFYNVAYITRDGDGIFTPVSNENGIYYSSKKNVDFIAYYPYRSTIENYLYEISLLEQTSQEQIDFLYSDSTKNQNKTSDPVKLYFSHQLAKLQLRITSEEELNLSELTVKISGCRTQGVFNLATGELTIGEEEEEKIINTCITKDESSIICEAILFPGTKADNLSVYIQLNERKFNLTTLPEIIFEKGKRYIYNIKLKKKQDDSAEESAEEV